VKGATFAMAMLGERSLTKLSKVRLGGSAFMLTQPERTAESTTTRNANLNLILVLLEEQVLELLGLAWSVAGLALKVKRSRLVLLGAEPFAPILKRPRL
jgi:hypothetical protein